MFSGVVKPRRMRYFFLSDRYLLLEHAPTLLEQARRVLALLSYSLRPRKRHPLVVGVLGRNGVAELLEDLQQKKSP